MQTTTVPFYNWAQIGNATVVVSGSGRFTKSYLNYDYPGGRAEINIELLAIESHALQQLLDTYRSRYDGQR